MTETFKYSFTLTLKPNLYKESAEVQYDKTYLTVVKLLMGISRKFSVVAELTSSFNIHYHGIISFELLQGLNQRKKFTDHFRNNSCIGFVNIKQITDDKGWVDYITKDLKVTKHAINRPPVLLDYFNILPVLKLDGMIQHDMSDDC